jgi:tetratricopeptide (TPR) repeat protein
MARLPDEAHAIALFQSGRFAEAESAFKAILAREPRNAAALHALGAIALQAKRFDEAIAGLVGAVASEPRDALAHYHLASAYLGAGRSDDARASLQAAIAAHRAAGESRFRLANVLPAALEALAALEVQAGNACKDAGDLHLALAHYEAALAANPRLAEAALNAGSVALERGDHARAKALYEQALRLRPGLADAEYALGLIALFAHDFARGWEGYERRFETSPAVAALAAPRRPAARHFSDARRLAVRAEQGLGDQILFSTLLPELAALGVSGVVEIDPRLVRPYRRSQPGFEYCVPGDIMALETCDREIAIGSLARHLRRAQESFAAQPRALLVPDPARAAATRTRFGEGRHVAISWRSFQPQGRGHIAERKSIPLAHFAALAPFGAKLVDLQYGDVDDERRAFDRAHPGLRIALDALDLRNDLEGLLAAIAACDLVVTSSNVTAHFAGALGKATWLLYLGANPPFHYWAPGADARSLWYPSVEVLTDAKWHRWEDAFDTVAWRLRAEL